MGAETWKLGSGRTKRQLTRIAQAVPGSRESTNGEAVTETERYFAMPGGWDVLQEHVIAWGGFQVSIL